MLSKSSFNALLKTLEEPPKHSKFLLATTDPQKVPISVLSRCLQFTLQKLTHEEILGQLKFIMETEKLKYEELAHIAHFLKYHAYCQRLCAMPHPIQSNQPIVLGLSRYKWHIRHKV
jgi:replication-associated recombination protein RarA